jgi:hypothetical protein
MVNSSYYLVCLFLRATRNNKLLTPVSHSTMQIMLRIEVESVMASSWNWQLAIVRLQVGARFGNEGTNIRLAKSEPVKQ